MASDLANSTEVCTNPTLRISNFSNHRKGMGKLKEFPSYGFLNIFGVKYMLSVKYGRSEFPYYRENMGKHKLFHIIGLFKIFRIRQMVTIPKTCGKQNPIVREKYRKT